MTPGLVNSVINARLVPVRPTIQAAMFEQDDPQAVIASLRRDLAESEAAYDKLCEAYAERNAVISGLLREVTILRQRDEMHNHLHIYGHHGLVRR